MTDLRTIISSSLISYLENRAGSLHVPLLAVPVQDGLECLPVGLDAVLREAGLQVLGAELVPTKNTLVLHVVQKLFLQSHLFSR